MRAEGERKRDEGCERDGRESHRDHAEKLADE
jgi:hypothetical protein